MKTDKQLSESFSVYYYVAFTVTQTENGLFYFPYHMFHCAAVSQDECIPQVWGLWRTEIATTTKLQLVATGGQGTQPDTRLKDEPQRAWLEEVYTISLCGSTITSSGALSNSFLQP